jgi:hypothetical protein
MLEKQNTVNLLANSLHIYLTGNCKWKLNFSKVALDLNDIRMALGETTIWSWNLKPTWESESKLPLSCEILNRHFFKNLQDKFIFIIAPQNQEELISIFSMLPARLNGTCFVMQTPGSEIDSIPTNTLNAKMIQAPATHNIKNFLQAILFENQLIKRNNHNESTKRFIALAQGKSQSLLKFSFFNCLPNELVFKIINYVDPDYDNNSSIESLFTSVETMRRERAEAKYDCLVM